MTDRLYHDPDLARFYDGENGWAADTEACRNLAQTAQSVLDLGCGTGLLAAALAQDGLVVTGVDPAAAMLDIARARPGGDLVTWVNADARDLRLDRQFDLIVLTGHAFQVFLTEACRARVLATIAAHLAPRGRFVFDSRNPACREWESWQPETSQGQFDDPDLGPVKSWNDVGFDPATGIVTYETFYHILRSGKLHQASSRIAFPDRAGIARLADKAGLAIDDWHGDWQFGPWHDAAPEIIPLGRLA